MDESHKGQLLYRLPGEKNVYHVKGKVIQPKKLSLEHKGFVIAPFKEGAGQKLSLLIPESNRVVSAADIGKITFIYDRPFLNHFVKKYEYLQKIEEAKKLFTTDFRKVVLSRRKKIQKFRLSNATDNFLKLAEAYPNSFIYVFSSEYTGTWGGASPELFLSYADQTVHTMALAGTIALKDTSEQEICWMEKEQEEHHIVELFIEHILTDISGAYTKKGPYTQITGSLAHLLSRYNASLLPSNLTSLIKKLHPTPAVCGLPKQKSYDVIEHIETYNRAYYTGFLGPWNLNNKVELFVNLRCMQYFNDHAVLYAGGGITTASDAEQEWIETENKMRSVTKITE